MAYLNIFLAVLLVAVVHRHQSFNRELRTGLEELQVELDEWEAARQETLKQIIRDLDELKERVLRKGEHGNG